MSRTRVGLLAGMLAALAAGAAGAQQAADSAAPPPAPAGLSPTRASWVSDRMPLRVGDILTVVVDEQTAASERVSQVATGNRTQRTNLNAGIGDDVRLGPSKGFGTGMNSDSRDVGEAGRRGDLTAVLSVRVTAVEPNGVAHIEGHKEVTVDGRKQEITVQGLVRSEDIAASNYVLSNRIAESVITYRGKKIGPRQGILGRILSILWP